MSLSIFSSSSSFSATYNRKAVRLENPQNFYSSYFTIEADMRFLFFPHSGFIQASLSKFQGLLKASQKVFKN